MIGPNDPRNGSLPTEWSILDFHPDDWALIESFTEEGFNIIALTAVTDAGAASNDGGDE